MNTAEMGREERIMAISVLLVDDEVGFVESLAKRLAIRQFEVSKAFDAETALEILAENPKIDVVLLDVKMPGTDGLAAIKTIKRRHPLVEVILLSGHANLETSVGGMALGAFDYLLKPVRIDELVYKVEDAHHRKTLQEDKIRSLDGEETVESNEQET
jgi:DNA-binding NtrC family response regulator